MWVKHPKPITRYFPERVLQIGLESRRIAQDPRHNVRAGDVGSEYRSPQFDDLPESLAIAAFE